MSNESEQPLFGRRLFAAAVSVGCVTAAVYLGIRGSQRPVFLNQSIASLLVMSCCSAMAVLSAVLIFLSAANWRLLAQFLNSIRNAEPFDLPAYCSIPFFLFALLCFSAIVMRFCGLNQKPIQDQQHFLVVSEQLSRTPGPASLWTELFRGTVHEDNRHPLYLWFLSFDPTMHTGKVISSIAGFAFLVLTARIVSKGRGSAAGLFATAILCVNFELLHQSALVSCETLLVLFLGLAWYQLAQHANRTFAGCLMIGALFGFGYLSKASALMFFALTWFAIFLQTDIGWKKKLSQSLGLLVGFGVVASPLLVRNFRVYESPIHNFNSRMLFADSFDEGDSRPPLGLWKDFQRYRSKHTDKQMMSRLLEGAALEVFVLVRSLGPSPLQSERAVVGALFLLVAFVAGFRRNSHERWLRLLLSAWIVVAVLFFGWYQPIASGDRFVLPLVPALTWHAAVGFAGISSKFANVKRRTVLVVVLGLCWIALWTASSLLWIGYQDFFPS